MTENALHRMVFGKESLKFTIVAPCPDALPVKFPLSPFALIFAAILHLQCSVPCRQWRTADANRSKARRNVKCQIGHTHTQLKLHGAVHVHL